MLPENIKNEILESVLPLKLERVILFGSYAWGTPDQDSDIDLYIVTRDDYIPSKWSEKRDIVRKVSRQMGSLRKKYAIDLIVHTKAMHDAFITLDSSFSHDIVRRGTILL